MYNSDWFNTLKQPFLSPPGNIFGPVWAILYVLISLAILLYILKPANKKIDGYIYFAIQLLLNLVWPLVFFGTKNILFALLIILLLDIFAFLTITSFFRVCKISAILLVPYFLWILFATYLNAGYLILNQ